MVKYIASIILSITILGFKANAIDEKSESSNGGCLPSKPVERLEDFVQSCVSQWVESVYDRETILQLPFPILNNMIQKRQLPIHAPEITQAVLLRLKEGGYWQDPWGYQWLTDLSYSDLEKLLELNYSMDEPVKNMGTHGFQYKVFVRYHDFDPIDYMEIHACKDIHFSIKLSEKRILN